MRDSLYRGWRLDLPTAIHEAALHATRLHRGMNCPVSIIPQRNSLFRALIKPWPAQNAISLKIRKRVYAALTIRTLQSCARPAMTTLMEASLIQARNLMIAAAVTRFRNGPHPISITIHNPATGLRERIAMSIAGCAIPQPEMSRAKRSSSIRERRVIALHAINPITQEIGHDETFESSSCLSIPITGSWQPMVGAWICRPGYSGNLPTKESSRITPDSMPKLSHHGRLEADAPGSRF